MSDLIDRQAAIEIMQSLYPGMPRVPWLRKDWQKRYEPYINAEKAIRALPSAQPTIEPERTGRWIEFTAHNAYKCSECGRIIETVDGKNNVCKHYPYCHCGCRMLKEGEDHETD